MNRNEILNELKEILMIGSDFSIHEPIDIDSLSTLMIIEFFDDKLNQKITREDIASFTTLEEILNYIDQ